MTEPHPWPVHRITRDEWIRMIDTGAIAELRVELLCGLIVDQEPQTGAHIFARHQLSDALRKGVGDAIVLGATFAATDDSVPEPDVLVLPADQVTGRALPERAWLVVEVAESFERDRRKADIYAAANVPEYWIVDLHRRFVRLFSEPSDTGYLCWRTVSEGVIAPAAFPEAEVDVASLFPKV